MRLSIAQRMLVASHLVLLSAPLAAGGNTGTVVEVIDGDVVRFGESFVARLVGVSAPPRDSPFGETVFEFTRSELEGELVTLFTWTTDDTAAGIVYDREGRAFVQIFIGEDLPKSFNELLLERGFAEVDEEHLPAHLAERYRELERAARRRRVGIWGSVE
jgi:endonuclease YncB( thermonuclease family)